MNWICISLSAGCNGEPDSTVSIVSSRGLDDQLSSFDPWQRRKDFSFNLCFQTGCEAHPATCTVGTVGPFPGAKVRLGRDGDHSPQSTADVENE
jgi:hypothetical protein